MDISNGGLDRAEPALNVRGDGTVLKGAQQGVAEEHYCY